MHNLFMSEVYQPSFSWPTIRSQKVMLLKQIVLKFREVRKRAGVEDVVQELDQQVEAEEQDCTTYITYIYY